MKDKLTCYIVDDEPLAEEILKQYVAKVPFLELKGSFGGAIEASAHIEKDKPDVLFLDINMPDLDGLSFIPMLNARPNIILTTAYDQYALKAFDLEVFDYLLKPIPFERFYKSVLRLNQSQNSIQPSPSLVERPDSSTEKAHLFLKVGHRIQKVAIKEILFVQGMKDYLQIHTSKEKIMTLMNFASLEELLPSNNFVRVHKSYLVAIDKIDHIEKNRIWIGDQIIPISETYGEQFYKLLRGLS